MKLRNKMMCIAGHGLFCLAGFLLGEIAEKMPMLAGETEWWIITLLPVAIVLEIIDTPKTKFLADLAIATLLGIAIARKWEMDIYPARTNSHSHLTACCCGVGGE